MYLPLFCCLDSGRTFTLEVEFPSNWSTPFNKLQQIEFKPDDTLWKWVREEEERREIDVRGRIVKEKDIRKKKEPEREEDTHCLCMH